MDSPFHTNYRFNSCFIIYMLILLSFLYLTAKTAFATTDSYTAGYKLGYTNGKMDKQNGHPSNPSGTASSYEWVAKSNDYDLGSFRQGFISGYEDGYFTGAGRGETHHGYSDSSYMAILIIITLTLIVLVVIDIINRKKSGVTYIATRQSTPNGCMSGCATWFIITMLLTSAGIKAGWLFVMAIIDGICVGYFARRIGAMKISTVRDDETTRK